ncbi:MAG: hypothetical protein M1840_005123 [Geoglossum simile]|nr:MAG: hypothetical protein M1840_005123 [Geoglossum simile]
MALCSQACLAASGVTYNPDGTYSLRYLPTISNTATPRMPRENPSVPFGGSIPSAEELFTVHITLRWPASFLIGAATIPYIASKISDAGHLTRACSQNELLFRASLNSSVRAPIPILNTVKFHEIIVRNEDQFSMGSLECEARLVAEKLAIAEGSIEEESMRDTPVPGNPAVATPDPVEFVLSTKLEFTDRNGFAQETTINSPYSEWDALFNTKPSVPTEGRRGECR